jgi:hypothetical protein
MMNVFQVIKMNPIEKIRDAICDTAKMFAALYSPVSRKYIVDQILPAFGRKPRKVRVRCEQLPQILYRKNFYHRR